jgi:LCP family protein required for cell wall assembly
VVGAGADRRSTLDAEAPVAAESADAQASTSQAADAGTPVASEPADAATPAESEPAAEAGEAAGAGEVEREAGEAAGAGEAAPEPATNADLDAEADTEADAGTAAPKRWWRLRRAAPAAAPTGPGGTRPPTERGRAPGRDPLWARLFVIFGALLVLAASGAITATKVLANRYDSAVKKGTLIAPEARSGGGDERHGQVIGPLNYLLIGSDARADDPSAGQRSDTIIILHIPATMDRAYLISIPRDLRVEIPPFPPTGFLGAHEKINGAFDYGEGGEGGVQLLSATLSKLIGITFDGAAVVDFGGFEKVIQQLGGVNMCIDERTESHHIGHDKNGNFLAPWYGPDGSYRNPESTPEVYEPGCRRLAPWQALDYSRQRKSIPDGDYGRQRHQQQLLKAMFDEARRQGIATSPRRLDAMIRSVGQSLTVDTNGVPLSDLMYALRDVNPGDLVGIKVPSQPQDIGGISYVLALDDQAPRLYDAIRADTLDTWVLDNQTWINAL